ncbi:unnamed protein product [Kuraishia capsulata CBS 1993]|uniref:Uncharacterized protein n=1 Tax=Kuraishia capsulata CBS 1993 TaxID=1382522 RepID=W6MN50_9ASCO|nr:uncharacterized protein KUCA_T00002434001 [Kuraishia capsulata CBS 1993]CDK26462.1 unnamed protein product [Kuraishia capsulata CBS 1993]
MEPSTIFYRRKKCLFPAQLPMTSMILFQATRMARKSQHPETTTNCPSCSRIHQTSMKAMLLKSKMKVQRRRELRPFQVDQATIPLDLP